MDLIDVPGIGEKTVSALSRAGITTINSLLSTFPRTYRLFQATPLTDAQVGDWIILKGSLTRPISRHTARTTTQIATFSDLHGSSLTLRWFNMPYLARSLDPNHLYLVRGQLTEFAGRKQIIAPQLAKTDLDTPLVSELVPIYRQIGSLKPWVIRQKISLTLKKVPLPPDPLPSTIVSKYALLDYQTALSEIHHPSSDSSLASAVHRLSFDELYSLQLKALQEHQPIKVKTTALKFDSSRVNAFLSSLPFTLTSSQEKAIKVILGDLTKTTAMNRLLQGEVGSGKTILAVAAAIATHSAGFRTVLMAPTQILANQLYDNFLEYCNPLEISVSLLTAKSKGDDSADILVGTQALLNKSGLSRIGLVIIDEQHRFGVEQRSKLANLTPFPHVLMMTATPIPRSLAQTMFGQLKITRLTELPASRLPVKTFLVGENKRLAAYDWIAKEIADSHNQVFMITPLIEIAEENETTPLKSVHSLETELHTFFPKLSIDLMHGKMKEIDKITHLNKFKEGLTDILVATSMLEVGIDIKSANLIVIENAERFGLSQLHQLRGRVGRGDKQAYCLLFSNSHSQKAKDRLSYFLRENNGEKLAKFDLQSRGPGELFGLSQHGFFNLKLGNLYDEELINDTFAAAKLTLDKKLVSP
ncbi:MAG: ATP-dependent DNA helicase RecG [bacterium]